MLVYREPSIPRVPSEDNRLPLVRRQLLALIANARRHPVREDRHVSGHLDRLVAGGTLEHPETVLSFPPVPLGFEGRAGTEHPRCRVEDERGVRREASEVLVAAVATECLDEVLRC